MPPKPHVRFRFVPEYRRAGSYWIACLYRNATSDYVLHAVSGESVDHALGRLMDWFIPRCSRP